MTARSALLALADRCEREEPTSSLNCAISKAITGKELPALLYVWSLDAAVTLCPADCWREQDGPRKYLGIPSPSPNYWRCQLDLYEIVGAKQSTTVVGWAATEAMAVCAAALKARADLTVKG